MITPGQWQLAGAERGEPMTRDNPGIPDQPAYIYVTRGDQEVVIAQVLEPMYWEPGHADREYEEVVGEEAGDWEDNARLLTFSPALVRFVQKLAAQEVGFVDVVSPVQTEAGALLAQLAQVEVRNDADRW